MERTNNWAHDIISLMLFKDNARYQKKVCGMLENRPKSAH